jgi:hypothetical protein
MINYHSTPFLAANQSPADLQPLEQRITPITWVDIGAGTPGPLI